MRAKYLWMPLFAVALVAVNARDARATPIQWTVAVGGNDHFYEYFAGAKSWADAQLAAAALGGYLATSTSEAENAFIADLFLTSRAYAWLGGFQDNTNPAYSEPAGGWVWATGEAFTYTNWTNISCCHEPNDAYGPGNPRDTAGGWEDHLMMTTYPDRVGTWVDFLGSVPMAYVVETEQPSAVPDPGSSLLLLGMSLVSLRVWRKRRL